MFGLVGQLQYAMSGVTSIIIPTVEVVTMPKYDDENMQKLYESDPLNSTLGIRCRVGRELIEAYRDIEESVAEVQVPFYTMAGEREMLVNPQAAKRFYDGASSTDKKYKMADGRWHNLLVEPGCEKIWTAYADWIPERAT